MSSKEEARQRGIERLLDQLEAAAARWAEAEHQEGADSGRRGVVSASVARGRDRAELKFQDLMAKLRRAVRPPEPLSCAQPQGGRRYRLLPARGLALYARDKLAEDARLSAEGSGFSSFTLAHNVASKVDVDAVFALAVAAGAKQPTRARTTLGTA